MEQKELMEEFEFEFQKIKNELNFKVSLDELDRIFFIRDTVKHQGYVSSELSRQICSRIVDTYNQWVAYLNSLIMPNQSYIPIFTEQEMLSETDKEKIYKLITQIMALISKNTVIALKKTSEEQGMFIDEAYEFWNETFSKHISRIATKINSGWTDKLNEKEEKKTNDNGMHFG